MISTKLENSIRDIADFPKPGIVFKDITPILKDASLCREVIDEFVNRLDGIQIDVIAGIESRGFLFGLMLANRLGIPFVPIRKKGKLPFKIVEEPCELEYGSAILELHTDAIYPGQRVLIHDDLLATGGTVSAATRLVQKLKGEVAGYAFVISLDFLNAREKLELVSENIITLVSCK
ncbi:MAG: adenine phosphoribosyltransferase [Sphingobacteriales bacterium 17-39-43]|uniref:adenine phosphoribosyltransferase n=1 Tax=Daejeonella sp. TaxID=2805397 RepID=UPI000BD0C005|nr:adenine phosphoribosyltransferase [Daejeonella sp.]OYX93903.1 MAG: adenine phosphoribosyltransferase [Sphingobacteriia bacterium 35-40-5]OYZ33428.1 MAG: adenine phosphoribosyltransferase [Sphingobacteriales bacterium 16-39-50]OYZ54575.1 MAG: adenine phosphoribosyltransferase [Sphingobacteriales bacterium 24-40-4]OZA24471.1 MAG: adenine phosphoribosyltransferase [Sphingobacteriales bacterium 17-39-43]HQS06094.1 adenine phosphoribosyltransferase [Daejeonella sp.]